MPKFVFAFHGGATPATREEGERAMAAWGRWFQDMGDQVVDPGHPVGKSKTVSLAGVADDGGANPLTGVTIVSAPGIDAAMELARGCPILAAGGTVEVAEALSM